MLDPLSVVDLMLIGDESLRRLAWKVLGTDQKSEHWPAARMEAERALKEAEPPPF
jgi:hypothetical protein